MEQPTALILLLFFQDINCFAALPLHYAWINFFNLYYASGVWKGYQVYILCVLGCGRDTRSIYYASGVWKGRKEYQVYIYSTIENIAVGRTTDLVPLKGY